MPNSPVPYVVSCDLHDVVGNAHHDADNAMSEVFSAEKQDVSTTWIVHTKMTRKALFDSVVSAFKAFHVSAGSATILVDRVSGKPFIDKAKL